MNSKKERVGSELFYKIEERARYYKQQEEAAAKEFVKTTKREPRDRALTYKGKAEAYQEMLDSIENSQLEEAIVIWNKTC